MQAAVVGALNSTGVTGEVPRITGPNLTVRILELKQRPFPTKTRNDVSLRTKERAWKELRERGLVRLDDGLVRLVDAKH